MRPRSIVKMTSLCTVAETRFNVVLGLVACSVVMTVFVKAEYVWRNKSRDKIWTNMTAKQKDDYIRTTKGEGSKRLISAGALRPIPQHVRAWRVSVLDIRIYPGLTNGL